MEILRECKYCGCTARTEEELEKFDVDSKSKHGRKNICKKCKAKNLKPVGWTPLRVRTCACGVSAKGDYEIEKVFYRASPVGDSTIGTLTYECKKCRFKDREGFTEIKGNYIKEITSGRL